MPRSSKAPEPPPEPDVNELIQNDVAKIKRLLGLDVNRLALGSEVEGIVGTGVFGPGDYTITGVNVIEFVNVSTSLGPSQGGSPPPPQVTGLSASVISNTQINLAWTAYGGSDFNFYTVYRGTSPGFSADSSSDIATPTTNSYNNTGLTAGTAYYYRVATTNDANIEGSLSSEASATTTGGGDVTPPGQVTGLAATVINDTQINLGWTASGAGDLNHYDVHRSTTTGFTPAVGNRISQPTSNSYNNTGLTASTTYYYKVGAVDNASNIGTYSTQASGTTTAGGGGISPTLLLHLDGNFTDSSGNGLVADNGGFAGNGNGYQTPGKFGSSALRLNAPVDDDPAFAKIDLIEIADTALIRMSAAFSVSFWVYPTDITSAGPARRKLACKYDDATNKWEISFDPATAIIYFCVQKAGVDYKRQMTGLAANSWQHICAVFDGSTVELYKNAVAGATTSGAAQYVSSPSMIFGVNIASIKNTHYEGYIDEVQYFQTALTSTNVTNLMNSNTT